VGQTALEGLQRGQKIKQANTSDLRGGARGTRGRWGKEEKPNMFSKKGGG